MKYGIWAPIFGGWLRNVADENMSADFDYVSKVVKQAENLGYEKVLVAELNLNDIKGVDQDVMEAWTTSAALAAVTEKIEILAAVRPGFHNPAITAKMAANIDLISNGRFTLNVVSAWWEEEARQYGAIFTAHNERYDRTEEFIQVLKGLWTEEKFTFDGQFYQLKDVSLHPKPRNQPTLYAGGESPRGKEAIVNHCDSYVMHGGTVEEIAKKISEMKQLRKVANLEPFQQFGMAAYIICRDTEEEVQAELARITKVEDMSGYAGYKDFTTKSKLEQVVALQDYSVSNRGLRPGLIGTPEQIAAKIKEYEAAGLDFLLLQCSPQHEEMERFAKKVMPLTA